MFSTSSSSACLVRFVVPCTIKQQHMSRVARRVSRRVAEPLEKAEGCAPS